MLNPFLMMICEDDCKSSCHQTNRCALRKVPTHSTIMICRTRINSLLTIMGIHYINTQENQVCDEDNQSYFVPLTSSLQGCCKDMYTHPVLNSFCILKVNGVLMDMDANNFMFALNAITNKNCAACSDVH